MSIFDLKSFTAIVEREHTYCLFPTIMAARGKRGNYGQNFRSISVGGQENL